MTMLPPLLLLLACDGTGITVTDAPADTAPADDTGRPDTDAPPDSAPPERIPGDTSGTGDDTGEEPDKEAVYEAFFDPTVMQTIDLVLSTRAINQLNRNPDDYVEGEATVNGVRFASVGVRLKGSSTFQDLDCSDGYCKAGFKIKLDEFVPDQKYGGLQRITLNNMTTDYTQSKEVIVYDLLHRHGQLASRCSYARVTLNGESWGLYANLESADDEWLERRFADSTGNFWGTGDSYGDFVREYIDGGGWVLKSGDGDMTLLENILRALDTYTGDFAGELGPYINVEQFLTYWGWCAALGNFDGYPFVINDVLIYADPSDGGRLAFAPWGTDESWNEYEYTGQTWNTVSGRLGAACLADPECEADLKAQILIAVEAYEAEDVLGMAEAAWALSEEEAQGDPHRPYGYDYVSYYRDYYAALMPDYGTYVRRHAGL